jgi:hypothetical protein
MKIKEGVNHSMVLNINDYNFLTRSQLLKGFKCESKLKTMEEQRIEALSMARSTLKG